MLSIKNLVFLMIVSVFFAGCGLKVNSTGIQKLGPDTYFVATSSGVRGNAAKTQAYQEANQYCNSLGKYIVITERKSVHNENEITFMCLNKDDYELKRPKYTTTPDIVIENR